MGLLDRGAAAPGGLDSPCYDIVVPTVGRPSLQSTLRGIAEGPGPWPQEVIVVDDRVAAGSLDVGDLPSTLAERLTVLTSGGRGPAAARNVGWLRASAPWIAYLDDDVVPSPGWRAALAEDLQGLGPLVGASQGRITVPLSSGRRPTDWERQVLGLSTARWITADLAVRRTALRQLGGFDERFPRAYREDADLAVRLRRSGHRIADGSRQVTHPVRPAPWSISIQRQIGNVDDALMRRKHGPTWRRSAKAGRGRLTHHAATTATLVTGAVMCCSPPLRRLGRAVLVVGAADIGWYAWQRVRPGPRTGPEVGRMVLTSAVIPPLATAQRIRGWARARRLVPRRRPGAILFDRDGTLVHDVPYNGDPSLVEPMPGARDAIDRLRRDGIAVGVVSNQSGVARGILQPREVDAVNARIDELLGPFDTWRVCLHGEHDRCACRKPAPGLVHAAAADLGVPVERCVVIGDIGVDIRAARHAGAGGIMVPTATTRPEEIADADIVCLDLEHAVDLLIGPAR